MSTVKLTYEGEVDIEKSPREVRLPPTHPHPPPPPPLDTNPLTVPSPCTTDSNHHMYCARALHSTVNDAVDIDTCRAVPSTHISSSIALGHSTECISLTPTQRSHP
jgi:hypothetical protein